MIGFLVSGVLALLAYTSLTVLRGRYRPWERRLIGHALLAHFVGVGALLSVYLFYYGGGDLTGYHRSGVIIANHLSTDFGNVAPRLLDLLLGVGGTELAPHGAGGSTGSMHAVAGILAFVFGDSILASSMVIATAAFWGKLAIYSVFRRELSVEYHRATLIGCLLVPSAVFWCGSLLKEAVAMSFLGALIWGGYTLVTGRQKMIGGFCFVLGVVGCHLIKGYLLVPAAVAAMVWLYVRRAKQSKASAVKPLYLLGAAAAILGLLLLIGNLTPRYDVFRAEKQLAQEAATMGKSEGGSNYSLVDSSGSASSVSMLLVAPWAVLTALLRPAIIEARNPLSFVNGLETLVLTLMLIRVLRRRPLRQTLAVIRNSPTLSFCAVFTLLLALGVGFATTNMGTLSRYRMPLVPFFVVLLGVLGTRAPRQASVKNKARRGC